MDPLHNTQGEYSERFPILDTVGRGNPYSVPQDYFETLPDILLEHIKTGLPPATKNGPFSIPDNYFDNLPNRLLQAIKEKDSERYRIREELAEIAPLLLEIDTRNVYSVPGDYFSNLQLKPVTTAKVVSFGSTVRRWINYAAAAAIVFVIGLSAFLYVNKKAIESKEHPNIALKLATLNDEEINSFLSEDPGSATSPALESGQYDLQQMFKNASDEEIMQYLMDTNGGAIEIELNEI